MRLKEAISQLKNGRKQVEKAIGNKSKIALSDVSLRDYRRQKL